VEQVTCPVCGKDGARLRHLTRNYGKGDRILLIENVPVISCPHCNESYLSAETIHELERLKREKRGKAAEWKVQVLTYA